VKKQFYVKHNLPIPETALIGQQVDGELVQLQTPGAKGGSALSCLKTVHDQRKFATWYKKVGKPAGKSEAGKQGGSRKHKKSLDASKDKAK
jgi:hypothetical protein